MRASRFTERQIVAALRQIEGGTPVVEVCRKFGTTEQTFYRWKRKFAGTGLPTRSPAHSGGWLC
jgi:putative transposase